ncbi:hypothetical protein DO225_16645 [Salmonella enterica]|nr:hypothetical protein [Salmonella enterica]EBN2823451.1 hypothetical protein [Salmonella enterica]ECU1628798.1 hypothetical protein [Salmonella enterica]
MPLPWWLNAIALSEMISDDCAQFGLFWLAPADLLPSSNQLHDLLNGLYHTFPLLDSHVAWSSEGPELHIYATHPVHKPECLNRLHYPDTHAFIRHQLQHPHSVFKRGMLRLVRARCGEEERWGIWLHHLIADADFMPHLLSRATAWLKTGVWPEPDLHFVQQIWKLNQLASSQHARLQQFWRAQEAVFSQLMPLPQREMLPESITQTFTLPDSPHTFTRIALALAKTLSQLNIPGPHLAVTPVTLRRTGQIACSGCYINLLPVLLDDGQDENRFEILRQAWLEHAALSQEEIASLSGVSYRQALVMINMVDISPEVSGFSQHPELCSRKPITLTLMRTTTGSWQGNIVTRWGETFSKKLVVAFTQALTS